MYCITYNVYIDTDMNSTEETSEINKTCLRYDGICNEHLTTLTDTDVVLTTHTNGTITEEQVISFFKLLKSFSGLVSVECSDAVVPFVCQYVYPPYDGNGSELLITEDQCAHVRDEVCIPEWRYVMTTEFGTLLPDCEELDENGYSGLNETRNRSEPLRCHKHFKEYCGVCLPLCGEYSPASEEVNYVDGVVLITSAILGLVGGVTVSIFSIIKRKTM